MKENTYKRKYYLHRRVKAAGFNLDIKDCSKTINIPASLADNAKSNKYVSELIKAHQYGAQIINPIWD